MAVDRVALVQAEPAQAPSTRTRKERGPELLDQEGEFVTASGWRVTRVAPEGADDLDVIQAVRDEWRDAVSDYFRDEAREAGFWGLRNRDFGPLEISFEQALQSFILSHRRNIALTREGANVAWAKKVRAAYDSALEQWLGSEEYKRFNAFRDAFRDHCIARWGGGFGFAW